MRARAWREKAQIILSQIWRRSLNVGILLLSALHISKSLCKLFSPVKELILSFSQVIQSSKGLNSYKEANGKRYFKIANYFVFLFLKV